MATTYRPGRVAEVLGVSVDTVRRWCDDGLLATTRTSGGHRVISGAELARFLADRATPFEPDGGSSATARNRFPGVVVRVERDGLVALVELQAGPHRLVSLVTAEAVDELDLQPGDLAIGVVKSTNVIVEVPT